MCLIFIRLFFPTVLTPQMREAERAALSKQEAEIIETLDEVVKKGGKIETWTQPPLVIENIEPPEIPELSMGEMTESPFTGEDAVRYMTRLSRRYLKGGEGGGSVNRGTEREGSAVSTNGDGTEKRPKDVVASIEMSQVLLEDMSEDGEAADSKVISSAGLEDGAEDSKRKEKKKRKRKKKTSRPSASNLAKEEIMRANMEELKRETNAIIREAAKTINLNQTPVIRRGPVKVYKMPTGDPVLPLKSVSSKASARTRLKSDPLANNIKSSTKSEDSNDMPEAKLGERVVPWESDEHPKATDGDNIVDLPVEQGVKTTLITREEGVSANNFEDVDNGKTNRLHRSTNNHKVTPTSTVVIGGSTPPVREIETPPPRCMSKLMKPTCESVTRQKPAWPTLEECKEKSLPKTVAFSSTWLSVAANGIK